jgi:hypothetical protein
MSKPNNKQQYDELLSGYLPDIPSDPGDRSSHNLEDGIVLARAVRALGTPHPLRFTPHLFAASINRI